jgi:hypothetical protein
MRDALRTLERSLAELTSFFFTLFTWTATWLAPLVISLFEFLDLFLLLIRRSLVYFLCNRVAPLCAFCYIQHYLQKKKKKKILFECCGIRFFDVWSRVAYAETKLLECWKGRFFRNDFKIVWNIIPSCLMWCMWREMNTQSFKDCKKTSLVLQLYFS